MTGKRRALVVHNPVAGTSDFESTRALIRAHFESAGIEYDHHVTQPDDAIAEIVRDAAVRGVDVVVAAGGDGTLSAAANGLVGTDVPLGVLPLGSGNAYARELGIPLDLEGALGLLTGGGSPKAFDTLTIGERHFVLNVSAGQNTEALATTEREQKRRFGKLAYLFEGLGNLSELQLQDFTIEADGRQIRTQAAEIIAANCGVVGFERVRLSPDIRPDDGVMHLCVIKAETLGSYLRLLAGALRGDPEELPELHCIPVEKSVRIEADRPQAVQGDGEEFGSTPVEITITPGAIQVIAPADGEKSADAG